MSAGGWPDAGAGWEGNAAPYQVGGGVTGGGRYPDDGAPLGGGALYADEGTFGYDETSYESSAYDPSAYDPSAYDTLPRGVSAHDALTYGVTFRVGDAEMAAAEEETYGSTWEFEEGLAALLQSSAPEPAAPPVIPRQRLAHRRRPRRTARVAGRIARLTAEPFPWLRLASLLIVVLSAVIVTVVGTLGGLFSYDPLRRLAAPIGIGVPAGWWPLLVYGPWLLAALSILRCAVHRRRAAHSWAVVMFFSVVVVCLSVAGTGHAPAGIAVAGLPPIAALVCFHQFVRQITLTSPPRNGPSRPRHTARRD